MADRFTSFLKSDQGAILSSILLGLGLATMCRYTCVGESCVVVQSPDFKELKTSIYEMDGKCYQYTPSATVCPGAKAPNT